MYKSIVRQLAFHVERQDKFTQVHHSDVSGQSGLFARIARSTLERAHILQSVQLVQTLLLNIFGESESSRPSGVMCEPSVSLEDSELVATPLGANDRNNVESDAPKLDRERDFVSLSQLCGSAALRGT